MTAATADMAKSKPEPHWPVGLYAPGKYICICADCGKQHIAAKRALHCADCTIQRLFNRIATDREKMDAMVADHLAAVQAAVAKAVEAERDRADSLAIECSVWSMPQGVLATDEWRRGVTDARRDIAAAMRVHKGDAL